MDKNNILDGHRELAKFLKCSMPKARKLMYYFPSHTTKLHLNRYGDITQVVYYKTEVLKGIVDSLYLLRIESIRNNKANNIK